MEGIPVKNRELSATFFGDIREDVKLLGFLTVSDALWTLASVIVGTVLVTVLFFINVWMKLAIILLLVLGTFFYRVFRIGDIRKKNREFKKLSKETQGSQLFKSIDEEGAFYISNDEWHCVFEMTPPPWNSQTFREKSLLISAFQTLLRTCATKKVVIKTLSMKQPDLCRHQWDIWERQKSKFSLIEEMKTNRIDFYRQLAQNRFAIKHRYFLRLSVNFRDIPDLLTKDKDEMNRKVKKHFREEVLPLVYDLEKLGFSYYMISGLNFAELEAEEMDHFSWLSWINRGASWEDSSLMMRPVLESDQSSQKRVNNDHDGRHTNSRFSRREAKVKMFKLGHDKIIDFVAAYKEKVKIEKLKPRKNVSKSSVPMLEDLELKTASFSKEIINSNKDKLEFIVLFSSETTGKTIIGINLAVAIAKTGRSVHYMDTTNNLGVKGIFSAEDFPINLLNLPLRVSGYEENTEAEIVIIEASDKEYIPQESKTFVISDSNLKNQISIRNQLFGVHPEGIIWNRPDEEQPPMEIIHLPLICKVKEMKGEQPRALVDERLSESLLAVAQFDYIDYFIEQGVSACQ